MVSLEHSVDPRMTDECINKRVLSIAMIPNHKIFLQMVSPTYKLNFINAFIGHPRVNRMFELHEN